jgi:hypothetical protein
MKKFFFILLFASFSSFSQSTNLVFQGFEKISDTLSTIQLPIGNGYYRNVVRDTVNISVPLNEVWIIDQSYISFKTGSVSSGDIGIDKDYSRNSIYFDDFLLHNLLNDKDITISLDNPIWEFVSQWNSNLRVRNGTSFFDKRIKILGGTHKIIRDIGVGSSFQMIHSIIFEKYSLN